MALNKDDIQKELDCYTKIINLFLKISKDPIINEIHKDKALIKIMNQLKDPKNANWLKNALIIFVSLFDEKPADIYSNLGINGKNSSKRDKEMIFSKIKEELLLKQREKKYNALLRKIKEKKED
ncbi:MAG: hypothetical protein KGD63_14940 [Candidatus Lokiarchaeota archaeon]|nr:hypothetical protein [Candidatus Lokiarchaeota archaeon]